MGAGDNGRAGRTPRLAVVTTHPVQYQAPWFRALAQCVDLEVLYCHHASGRDQAEAGFGVEFDWDVPLLEGYRSRFLENRARWPSLQTFSGVDTPQIGTVLDEGLYDAVLVHGWHYRSAWQAIRSCWRAHRPLLVRGDSHLKTPRSRLKRAAKRLPYGYFIRRFDACLPVGRWSHDYFLHFGARPERVFVVPYSIDDAWYSRRRVSRFREAREQLGFDDAVSLMVFVGKFTANKRPGDFVRALAAAAGRRPGIEGLMVGDGVERPGCEREAAALGAPVRFTGFLNQTQLVDVYEAADLLVLPSQTETWGLVVNEAFALGCPAAVSSGVGCGPDMIRPDETGWIFPVGDSRAIACHMESVTSQRLRSRLARGCKEMARGYRVERARDALLDALEQTVGRPGG